MDQLKKDFQNPSAPYRSAPLWVWNDLMEEEQIVFQLKELKNHGFGGAFIHPRPGLITEYLSDEWFRLWGFALQTAKELGMKLYIYDENSYPSGFAGGHVSALLPDCLAAGMRHEIITDPGNMHDDAILRAYSCTREEGRLVIGEEVSLYPREQWHRYGERFFVIKEVKPETTGWMGGFAYVDLLRPEVTEQFLKTTYDAYYQHFGEEFGKSIPAVFTDEPNIGTGTEAAALPFSYWLANEFEIRNGYSLLAHLPCVLTDAEGEKFAYPARKVRYDYYTTLHALWTEHFVRPVGEWCGKRGIAWTGHYLEHQWPFAYALRPSLSIQSHYEYHHWPAIDMLLSNYLRDTEAHAIMLTIQEARSAANQFQKERTLCELYGAGGWDSNFEDYKRMGDWVMVNGINFINQHLTYGTIAGARKRDHPQSFDWRQPWWEEYTQMNDYIARASCLLSRGVMEQRILVLNPSTTGYLIAYEEEQGSIFDRAGTDAVQNPDMSLFLETLQSLTDRQWDYDLGDEYTLERHGAVDNGMLRVGAQRYEAVVVSGDMKNMRKNTARLLEQLMGAGGTVIACGEPGDYIDGLRDEAAYASLRKGWTAAASTEALHELLLRRLAPRIDSSTPWPTGVTHMRRVLTDGRELYFFVNHNMDTFESVLTLRGGSVSRCVSRWDLFSGAVEPVSCEVREGAVRFALTLRRNQSVMLMVGGDAPKASRPAAAAETPVPLTLSSAGPEEPNMLPIQYCDLHLSGKTYKDIYAPKAADIIFQARGFDGNPWDNKVQYRSRLMERNHFGENSGFAADYFFTVAGGFIPEILYAVAERPALCSLWINGHQAKWLEGQHCMDRHFGVADIAAYVSPGKNKISIVVNRFDVCMELEPVYLRGDFSVVAESGAWVLTPGKTLQYGFWREQGYPFYAGGAQYRYKAALDKEYATALLEVGKYEATALSLTVNGQFAGLVNADGRRPAEIGPFLRAGENELVLRVCGGMRNLLGPHFMKRPVRGSAWPAMWKEAPVYGSPAPDAYDLLDFGLTGAPVLTVG